MERTQVVDDQNNQDHKSVFNTSNYLTLEEKKFFREIKWYLADSQNARGTVNKKRIAIELYDYILSHTRFLTMRKLFTVSVLKKLNEFYTMGNFTWAEYKKYYLPVVHIFLDLPISMPMMSSFLDASPCLHRLTSCCACRKRTGEYFIR